MLMRFFYLCLLGSTLCHADLPADIVGQAYTLDDGQPVYSEHHYIGDKGLDHRVVYRDPAESKLAEKSIDYRPGFVTPAFQQENFVDGSMLAVDWNDDDLVMRHREQSGASVQETRVSPSGSLVVDAGFDHFIRQRWTRLTEGERLTFDFPAPARQSMVGLRAAQVDCASSFSQVPEESVQGEGVTCFTISPANWFYRLVLEPIRLAYSSETQRLLMYQGLSNVKAGRDENFRVNIVYDYTGDVAPSKRKQASDGGVDDQV